MTTTSAVTGQTEAPRGHGATRPHLLYLAWGFPPAAKSCTYRMLATANSFIEAGWDVTVLTLTEEVWRREQGIDPSLRDLIDEVGRDATRFFFVMHPRRPRDRYPPVPRRPGRAPRRMAEAVPRR